jgi:hypothetical protein
MEPEQIIEYDQKGNHRIVAYGLEGPWARYHAIAKLEIPGGSDYDPVTYMHATDYWTGTLPVDEVFVIEKTGLDYTRHVERGS